MKLLSITLPILLAGLPLTMQQSAAEIASENLLENNNHNKDESSGADERSLTLILLPPSGILPPSPAPPRPGNVGDGCFQLFGCDNGLVCEIKTDRNGFGEVQCLRPGDPNDPNNLPRNAGDVCNPEFGCDGTMVCDISRTKRTAEDGTISVEVSHKCTFNPCLFETRTVMEAAHPAYDDSDATKRSASTPDGNVLLLDDFSTNSLNNFAYQLECEDAGGDYVELHYTADCSSGGDDEQSATLFVTGQPRCYSTKDCKKDSDEQRLFEEFTLVPTEERADIENGADATTWHCTGTLLKDKNETSPSFCQTETELLNQQNVLRVAERGVPPIVSTQKRLFGLFDLAEKLVQFSSDESDSFDVVCESNGGLVAEIPEGTVACGDSSFQVEGFSTCLWPLCDPGGDDQDVVAALFQARMAAADGFQNIKDCAVSSAMSMSISGAFAVVGALMWYLAVL